MSSASEDSFSDDETQPQPSTSSAAKPKASESSSEDEPQPTPSTSSAKQPKASTNAIWNYYDVVAVITVPGKQRKSKDCKCKLCEKVLHCSGGTTSPLIYHLRYVYLVFDSAYQWQF